MTPRNIDGLIEKFYDSVQKHRLDEGKYCRWMWQNKEGTRNLGSSEYGCADAANILYTIGRFETDHAKRQAAVKELQSFQNPETGLFSEPTHHYLHSTAHVTAALQLFDAKPLYPFYALEKYKQKENLYELLENLEWKQNPWSQSHQGAGIYAAFACTGEASLEWQKWYFDWLWNEADPETGMWRKGCIAAPGKAPAHHSMAGTFHYMFNTEHARQPLRYPDKLVDCMIDMYNNTFVKPESHFNTICGFIEVDWVFCLNRATRQTPHRFDEAKDTLRRFAHKFLDVMEAKDVNTDEGFNDLHALFGTVCCVAELQAALPGELESTYPLHLVLDRRPFI